MPATRGEISPETTATIASSRRLMPSAALPSMHIDCPALRRENARASASPKAEAISPA
jgi:hypothetical protein